MDLKGAGEGGGGWTLQSGRPQTPPPSANIDIPRTHTLPGKILCIRACQVRAIIVPKTQKDGVGNMG